MADCKLYEIPEELGAIMATITTDNGYSQTIPATGIVYASIDDIATEMTDSTRFPRTEIAVGDLSYEDISQEMHEVAAEVRINGWIKLTEELDDTLAAQKTLYEWAADIRAALMSIYDRQAAGTFDMPGFLLIRNIRQKMVPDKHRPAMLVVTNFEMVYDLDFSTR